MLDERYVRSVMEEVRANDRNDRYTRGVAEALSWVVGDPVEPQGGPISRAVLKLSRSREAVRDDHYFMQLVLQKAVKNVEEDRGGPFGACVVRGGVLVSIAGNSVTLSNDPTAHAEVNAIRGACDSRRTFSLEDCTLYTSCEPCPMCFGAVCWARIKRVVYGATREDARDAGFLDEDIYEDLGSRGVASRKLVELVHYEELGLKKLDVQAPFILWTTKDNRTEY